MTAFSLHVSNNIHYMRSCVHLQCTPVWALVFHPKEMKKSELQCDLSIKDTLNREHISNEDSVCSPNHIELCTN